MNDVVNEVTIHADSSRVTVLKLDRIFAPRLSNKGAFVDDLSEIRRYFICSSSSTFRLNSGKSILVQKRMLNVTCPL